jgi:ABC-type glutathione transport system ATPase component
MKESAHNAVRFERLQLQNYGVFAGVHDFVFNPGRTVIVGRSGSGKTTLCNALACLGAARGVLAYEPAITAGMSVTVTTSGNRGLIRKYRRLIFLRDRDMATCRDPADIFMAPLDSQCRAVCQKEAAGIFAEILQGDPYKVAEHGTFDPSRMAFGDRVCLFLAFAIAARKASRFDLPLVLESPFVVLDSCLRVQVDAFLRHQQCQQIFILSPHECGEGPVHYLL